MPSIKGLTVEVTNADGKTFREYGVQTLKTFSTSKKPNTTSCYIEARTSLRFCIGIKADMSFDFANDDDDASSSSKGPATRTRSAYKAATGNNDVESNEQLDDATKQSIQIGKGTGKLMKEGELQDIHVANKRVGESVRKEPPPFGLVAYLYIDGREKHESGCVVYLDEAAPSFRSSHMMKGRWVEESDGTCSRRTWVFTDVGISVEQLLSTLTMAEEEDIVIEDEEEELGGLSGLMNSSGLSGAGKIVIEFKRVVIKGEKPGFRPRFKAGEADQCNDEAKDLHKDVTHTTSVKGESGDRTKDIKSVKVDPYEPGEGIYARVEFLYVSKNKLMTLNLMDNDRKPIDRLARTIMPAVLTANRKRRNALDGTQEGSLLKGSKMFNNDVASRKSTLTQASPSSRSTENDDGSSALVRKSGRVTKPNTRYSI